MVALLEILLYVHDSFNLADVNIHDRWSFHMLFAGLFSSAKEKAVSKGGRIPMTLNLGLQFA